MFCTMAELIPLYNMPSLSSETGIFYAQSPEIALSLDVPEEITLLFLGFMSSG